MSRGSVRRACSRPVGLCLPRSNYSYNNCIGCALEANQLHTTLLRAFSGWALLAVSRGSTLTRDVRRTARPSGLPACHENGATRSKRRNSPVPLRLACCRIPGAVPLALQQERLVDPWSFSLNELPQL